jgi:hypothetical protein
VDSISLSVRVPYGDGIGDRVLTNQIGITVDATQDPQFGNKGDSGSVVVQDPGAFGGVYGVDVVGLYFAGSTDGTFGAANPIQSVLTALNVSLCRGSLITLPFLERGGTSTMSDSTPRTDPVGTLAWRDTNPIGDRWGGTLPYLEATDPLRDSLSYLDVFGSGPGLDPVKNPAGDKPPYSDLPGWQTPAGLPPVNNATPFVMATPHHAMGFDNLSPEQLQELKGRYEAELTERGEALVKMNASYQEGRLSAAEYQQFMALCGEYEQLAAQYQQLASQ